MKKLILGISAALMLTGISLSALAEIESTGQNVGNAVENTVHAVGNAFQQVGQTLNDAAITTSIYAKYANDPLVNPLQINVETNNGEVTLKGQVDADAEFERAIQLAATTEGVKDVNAKDLTVTPSTQFFTDSYITLEVKTLLLRNQYIDGAEFNTWNIHVETNNGVVYLIGKVKDEIIKAKIIEIAKSVNGVKDVKTDLTTEQ
jgi:hyperosmotically inducible protein